MPYPVAYRRAAQGTQTASRPRPAGQVLEFPTDRTRPSGRFRPVRLPGRPHFGLRPRWTPTAPRTPSGGALGRVGALVGAAGFAAWLWAQQRPEGPLGIPDRGQMLAQGWTEQFYCNPWNSGPWSGGNVLTCTPIFANPPPHDGNPLIDVRFWWDYGIPHPVLNLRSMEYRARYSWNAGAAHPHALQPRPLYYGANNAPNWSPDTFTPPFPLVPWRALPYQPVWGGPEADARANAAPDPAMARDWGYGVDARSDGSTSTRVNNRSDAVRRPPGPREKEKKVPASTAARVAFAGLRAIAAYSEANDFVEVLWRAIPRRYRTRGANNAERWEDVWNNWERIELGEALFGYLANEVQDQAIGRAMGRAREGARRLTGGHDLWSYYQTMENLAPRPRASGEVERAIRSTSNDVRI